MYLIRFYVGANKAIMAGRAGRALTASDDLLIEIYGGFTRYDAKGRWKQDLEEWTIVYEVISESAENERAAVFLRDKWEQDAVLVTVQAVESRLV